MLSSWKEIAQFFGKGVRTVQRWEKTLDLPIHRPPGAPSNVVLAKESDLEEWMNRGVVGAHMRADQAVENAFDSIEKAIRELPHDAAQREERLAMMRQRMEELRHALEQAERGSNGQIAA
ncbi:MAG: hypothetical protein JSS87_07580 [Acidobacteria bacterium]|nr:hypothetical protein [Acidobacteriota bacterium]